MFTLTVLVPSKTNSARHMEYTFVKLPTDHATWLVWNRSCKYDLCNYLLATSAQSGEKWFVDMQKETKAVELPGNKKTPWSGTIVTTRSVPRVHAIGRAEFEPKWLRTIIVVVPYVVLFDVLAIVDKHVQALISMGQHEQTRASKCVKMCVKMCVRHVFNCMLKWVFEKGVAGELLEVRVKMCVMMCV